MRILITGAAGNLGALLARHLLDSPHELRLMVHRKDVPADLAAAPNVRVYRADLADPRTLVEPCQGTDCIVHFAGILFAPRPERFLPTTNTQYVRNLVDTALATGVRKFIVVSFPHVEGATSPDRPATGRLDANPPSVHAQTRLAAEKYLLAACEGQDMTPVVLRSGTIYGRGVLMMEAARALSRRHLLAVWREPTWYHMLALPDFLSCVVAAIEGEHVRGIYILGDDQPLTLQTVLDAMATKWGHRRPWRFPMWSFYVAAALVEAFAAVFGTAAPLTRDFITIGRVSHVGDTSRMKQELLPRLAYPRLQDGLVLI
jgi:nucleoside-diphosphate-sugar epimerase